LLTPALEEPFREDVFTDAAGGTSTEHARAISLRRQPLSRYFFLGRCASALAAADLAAFDDGFDPSAFPAADAAFLLVVSVDLDCVSALAAADLAVLDADLEARVFAAAFAAAGLVFFPPLIAFLPGNVP
jgi:hypothetical protein